MLDRMRSHLSKFDMETSLRLSRKNCHIWGLDSIVLYQNQNGSLVRMFRTVKNHGLNKGKLGIHNHRYKLRLTGLYGCAVNVTYKESELGDEYFKRKFKDNKDIGDGESKFLSIVKTENIVRDNIISLTSNDLHTVYVEEGKEASWLVEEGKQERAFTYLYTNDPWGVYCCDHDDFLEHEISSAMDNLLLHLRGK